MKIPLVEIENVKRLSFGKESHLHGCHPRGKADRHFSTLLYLGANTFTTHLPSINTQDYSALGNSSQHILLAPNKNLFDILKTMKSNNLKSNFSN